jgi:hypothetical protein
MNNFQQYALAHPLARATGNSEKYWRLTMPWSIILTVNK